jgi:hypothetical protein
VAVHTTPGLVLLVRIEDYQVQAFQLPSSILSPKLVGAFGATSNSFPDPCREDPPPPQRSSARAGAAALGRAHPNHPQQAHRPTCPPADLPQRLLGVVWCVLESGRRSPRTFRLIATYPS